MKCNAIWYRQPENKSYKENKTTIQHKCSPPLKRETNSKLPSQACKLGLVKGFGKDICELVLGVNVVQVYIPFLVVVSQEMEVDIYMFGFWVEN